MRKLLWVGDAACESGFAKCTHNSLEALRKTWDVSVLGLNYRGDPHAYPYPIFPCWPGGDAFGVGRVRDIVDGVKPQVVIIQNDPWNIPAYMKKLEGSDVPVIGAIAIDGLNARGRALNRLTHAMFWTKFAQDEAIKGGMTIPSSVVPLGVDTNVFYPQDKAHVRELIGLPQDVRDGFIVGNVNRNQPRKRLDLMIRYFGIWIETRKIRDAFLYLHVAPTGDMGYQCEQLAEYYGFNDSKNSRLILAEPEMFHGTPEAWVARTYNAFDVQMTTTQGEGWGLTTLEGMACGIPQIVPDWAALGDWAKHAAHTVPCTSTSVTPMANVVGGVMDEELAMIALDTMYQNRSVRELYRNRGLELTAHREYRWDNIAANFAAEVERAVIG